MMEDVLWEIKTQNQLHPPLVLILVLMEYTLWDSLKYDLIKAYEES